MKILGRFENREQQRARQAAMAQLAAVREEYSHYCRSYCVSIEQALLDFEALIRHPMVQCVSFATIDGYRFFLIGTTHVSIKTAGGRRFNIGEFIIMIHRSGINDTEELRPTLLVENITPPNGVTGGVRKRKWQEPNEEGGVSYFAHPHVSHNPGEFCMSVGRDELNLAIAEGNLLEAFVITISALQSAGPNMAFHDLDNWPEA